MLGWQLVILIQNKGFGTENLYVLALTYLLVIFTALFAPKHLYQMRKYLLIKALKSGKATENLELVKSGQTWKYISNMSKDRRDLYPNDARKLIRIIEDYR